MCDLSNNYNKESMLEENTNRLLQYLEDCKDDEPFTLRQIDDDNRYYLRSDSRGYKAISLVYSIPNVCCEDYNSNGYKRICYKDQKILKHRLIYKLYGEIPDYINFEEMEVHHKNCNVLDNRLENLYLISIPNHRILHKFIDKYGIDNVEL